MVLFTLSLFVVALPETYVALHQPCAGNRCASTTGQLTTADIHTLQRLGFPLDAYAAYWLVIDVLLAVVFFAFGGYLAWRKSDDWLGLLVSAMLIGIGGTVVLSELLYSPSVWSVPTSIWYPLDSVIILSTFALFPNGRFAPRWTKWILLVYPAQLVVFLLFLRPLHLPGSNLTTAAAYGAPQGIALTLPLVYQREAPDVLPVLPAAVEVAAYRIAQEALTNVIRHAQARSCRLCLRFTQHTLDVEIIDDGVGLATDRPVGVGLISMREAGLR